MIAIKKVKNKFMCQIPIPKRLTIEIASMCHTYKPYEILPKYCISLESRISLKVSLLPMVLVFEIKKYIKNPKNRPKIRCLREDFNMNT
jgi:hypothetical protein